MACEAENTNYWALCKKKKVGDPDFAKSEGGLQLPDGVPPWSLSSDQGGECPFSMIAPRHLRL